MTNSELARAAAIILRGARKRAKGVGDSIMYDLGRVHQLTTDFGYGSGRLTRRLIFFSERLTRVFYGKSK